jgi:SSS family solute:Na+ symporter
MQSLFSMTLLVITAITYVLVAYKASSKVASQEDYLLGNRQFSFFSIMCTLLATQVGAGMLFGVANESYNVGLWGLSYTAGMAIGLIILALGVASRLRKLEISTTAEIYEKKFGSPTLRKIAGLISVITMAGIFAAQIVASKQLFSTLFELNDLWLIGFWLIMIVYTMFGGIRAIIATDILQVFLIVVIFTVAFFVVVPVSDLPHMWSIATSTKAPPGVFYQFLAINIPTIMFAMIEQDLAQRFFSAKTGKTASRAAWAVSALLLIFSLIPCLIGIFAKDTGLVIEASSSPLIAVFQSVLPPWGMTLIACALLAAICSTADSLLGAASTNLIVDFGRAQHQNPLLFARVTTFLVGIASLTVAYLFDDVIGIIIKSYEISIAALFVSTMIAIFKTNLHRIGAISSVTAGLISYLALSFYFTGVQTLLLAVAISLVGYMVGSKLMGPTLQTDS